MPLRYTLLVFIFVASTACRTKPGEQPAPQQSAPPTDQSVLKLKDVVIQNLPSPYYHFNYDGYGYVTQAVFASGLSFYDFTYTNNKVNQMLMNKDIPVDTRKDKLEFDYENGNVSDIRVIDKNNFYYKKCLFTYAASRQLQKLEWYIKIEGNFVKEETLLFSYYAAGNLDKLIYQSYAAGAQTASTYQDKYEDYDDKPNVDGFSLLHVNPYFLHFVLLPSVRIQQNNPRKVVHTGDGANYQITYTYTYDTKARPLTKNGDFVYTSGASSGTHVGLTTMFSYYD